MAPLLSIRSHATHGTSLARPYWCSVRVFAVSDIYLTFQRRQQRKNNTPFYHHYHYYYHAPPRSRAYQRPRPRFSFSHLLSLWLLFYDVHILVFVSGKGGCQERNGRDGALFFFWCIFCERHSENAHGITPASFPFECLMLLWGPFPLGRQDAPPVDPCLRRRKRRDYSHVNGA